jgi:hypothetical protein
MCIGISPLLTQAEPAVNRDLIWSQPPDLHGIRYVSDARYDAMLADDFVLPDNAQVRRVGFWGGPYYFWTPGDPEAIYFNIQVYSNYECRPGSVLHEYAGRRPDQTFEGYDPEGYPTYKYTVDVSFDVQGGTTYWLVAQAADHGHDIYWSRQQATEEVGCEAAFADWWFYYWDPVSGIVGEPFDASLELTDVTGLPGACCHEDGSCTLVVWTACNTVGGNWLGPDFVCDPDPCAEETGACCVPPCNDCLITSPSDCLASGGSWHGVGSTCHPQPCDAEPPGACCMQPPGGCVILPREECERQQGIHLGCGTPCDPDPCSAVPIRTTTWGRIKAAYRTGVGR